MAPLQPRIAFGLVLLLAAGSGAAQDMRIPVPRPAAKKARAAWTEMVRAGESLTRQKKIADAYAHFLRLVRQRPHDIDVLESLLLHAPDESARRIWAHRYASARVTGTGFFKPSRAVEKAITGSDPHPAAIAKARAKAVEDLATFVRKLEDHAPSTPLVVRWAAGLAYELLEPSPSLRARYGPLLNRRLEPALRDHPRVLKALADAQFQAIKAHDVGRAIEILACRNGFHTQAHDKWLEGPRPRSLTKGKNRLPQELQRLRSRRDRAAPEPLTESTIRDLRWKNWHDFDVRHASLGTSAMALSPSGHYRIETSCGVETLRQAIKLAERAHARLATWYGRDPFNHERGEILIVPSGTDLDCESVPDWWSGGFQRGNRTVLGAGWATVESLGRGLTHEFTHRFDHAIYPGLPDWLLEGRAVWTSNAYTNSTDKKFIPIHAVFERIDTAYLADYGEPGKLRLLIEDRIEDKRDYYTAGYALYTYLSSYRLSGRHVFADRLELFMRRCANRGNMYRRFLQHFVDGKNRRPKTFEEFAIGFEEFIRGFHWFDPEPFTEAYKHARSGQENYRIKSPTTWIGGRKRAEPWFGAGHARTAAAILERSGPPDAGLVAWCIALEQDEWNAEDVPRVAARLDAAPDPTGAWVLRAEGHRRFPGQVPAPPGSPPFRERLTGVWNLLAAFEAASTAYRKAGDARAAFALDRDRDRLARYLGNVELRAGGSAISPDPVLVGETLVSAHGWIETGLCDYEDRRSPGLWYVASTGDVTVGRSKERKSTGTADRFAHSKCAFIRSRAWIPRGRYVVRTRIHPETSYFRAAIVVGYARRDRRVRIDLWGGDFLYAVGKHDKGTALHKFPSIECRVDGRFCRESHLPGAAPHEIRKFPAPQGEFRIALRIEDDRMHVTLDGTRLCSYRMPGGMPIEGYIGLASDRGSCRFQSPTVERLDGFTRDRLPGSWPADFDLAARFDGPLERFVNRPVRDLPVGPAGTVFLLIPRWPSAEKDENDEGKDQDKKSHSNHAEPDKPDTREPEKETPRKEEKKRLDPIEAFLKKELSNLTQRISRLLRSSGYTEPLLVVLPDGPDTKVFERAGKVIRKGTEHPIRLLRHRWKPPKNADVYLLFVDPQGTLRNVSKITYLHWALPWAFRRWVWIHGHENAARRARARMRSEAEKPGDGKNMGEER